MPPSRDSQPPNLRVVLCDDVPALRELTRIGLEDGPGLEVVGEAGDAAAGIEAVSRLRPDVVLLDLSMPGMDGLEAIPLMRERHRPLGIVVFSNFAEARMADVAKDLGADRYIQKGEDFAALREVAFSVARERRRSAASDPHHS